MPRIGWKSVALVFCVAILFLYVLRNQDGAARVGRVQPSTAKETDQYAAAWAERIKVLTDRIKELENTNTWLTRVREENQAVIKSKTAEIDGLKLKLANPEIAQAPARVPAPAESEQKFITFFRNFGRLNNQLITVGTAFEAAKFLNWTVFLRSEDKLYDSACRGCENILVGVDDGIWDLPHMREHFNMLLESEVVQEYTSVKNHPVLGKHLNDKRCFLPGWPKRLNIDLLLEYANDKNCKVIDIGGKNGPTWIDGLKYNLEFFHALRPAPYIRQAADHFLASIDWGTDNGMPAIAVHSRIFWEGRHCRYGHEFCTMKVRQQINNDGKLIKDKAKVAEVAGLMCYPIPKNLNYVFKMSEIKEEITECGYGKKCSPWLLTTDSESGGNLEAVDKKHNARIFNLNDYRMGKRGDGDLPNRTIPYPSGRRGHEIRKLELSFADLYLLSKANYFVGNVYSTFTATVCKARGPRVVADSNTCRTLTDRGNDVFFQNAEKEGLPKDWKQHWQLPENKQGYARICKREFEAEERGETLHF